MSSKPWPHAPPHDRFSPGTYMVTCGAYKKISHLSSRKRLRFFCETLIETASSHGWKLEAWAVLNNHYHLVARSPDGDENTLSPWITELHRRTAVWLNAEDRTPERRVWHNYFETPLTYQKSYYARLNYVTQNAVKHGLVAKAEDYDWCSAAWFRENSTDAYRETVESFRTDKVKVYDEF